MFSWFLTERHSFLLSSSSSSSSYGGISVTKRGITDLLVSKRAVKNSEKSENKFAPNNTKTSHATPLTCSRKCRRSVELNRRRSKWSLQNSPSQCRVQHCWWQPANYLGWVLGLFTSRNYIILNHMCIGVFLFRTAGKIQHEAHGQIQVLSKTEQF